MPSSEEEQFRQMMKEIGETKMPFGRFKGVPLYNLPAEYLAWFDQKGFPQGKLGILMQSVYEAKRNGADEIFSEFRRKSGFQIPLKKPKQREWNFE